MTRFPYPISENAPETVRSATGKPLSELTLENVLSGKAGQKDFAITRQALLQQAEVARAACRHQLAENFERASEIVDIPADMLIEIYELLRPGRAGSASVLFEKARLLKENYGAVRMASFIEEAARAYERRSLFRRRY